LALERLWPLALPFTLCLLVFLVVSWLGAWQYVTGYARHGALLAFAFAGGFLAWRMARFVPPNTGEVTRRIERVSQLSHRPLTAQTDGLALGRQDELASALWAEHRRRMAAGIDRLRAGAASPDLSRVDPFALRAAALVTAFVAFGFSLGPHGGSVADAFSPPPDRTDYSSRIDAWIAPPAYTRKPPIYLAASGDGADAPAREAPQGSEFVLRIAGAGSAAALAFRDAEGERAIEAVAEAGEARLGDVGSGAVKAGEVKSGEASAAASREFKHALARSGTMILRAGKRQIAAWQVSILPDQAPAIRFSEMPKAALSGSLQFSYEVEDDYGVTRAEAEIEPLAAVDPDARPLVKAPEMILPLPRQRAKSGSAKVNRDLTQHPWAGAKVRIRLTARDDAGQTGTSEPVEMNLPGRNFANPLALAMLDQRRILAFDARKAPYVADLIDAVASAPDGFIDDAKVVLGLFAARRRIVSARSDDDLRASLDLLWEMALAVEFGDLTDAERKLRDAQERLSQALESGASDEEIARLTQELRKAMEEYMEALSREMRENPLAQHPALQNDMARTLRQRDLERMLDQIENLARSGSRDAARQMLSELQRMMDNLRAGRHQQQRRAEGSQMNQALDRLSELMRRQQELLDETFRLNQNRPQGRNRQRQAGEPRQNGEGNEQRPGENGESESDELGKALQEALKQLQQRQQQLEGELGQLGRELEALGLDPSREFGEAGEEMGEAGKNLGEGKPGDAAGDQSQALEALRRGAQSMMQQMAGNRQRGGEQAGNETNGGRDRERSDPLGRRTGSEGIENGEDTQVPAEIEAQRAREIMEAIRKRMAVPYAPRIEKDYLERLIDPR
jgi:uncharacterized protein (TIGR02302 family)